MSKLLFNINIFKQLNRQRSLNATAVWYLLKMVVRNGIIYNYDPITLQRQLILSKRINKFMTAKKLNNHIQNLISTGLAEIKHGHLMLDSVHTQKTFYKSSINFTDTTNFKEVKELLTLEYLKYTTHIQNKIIGIRNDIADSTIKAKVSKRKIKIVTKQKESFASEPIITFRNIAKVLNLSLTETYNILSLLKSKDFISLETKKICLGRSSGKLENFKDVLPLFAYSFISKGFLYQILGSNLSIL